MSGGHPDRNNDKNKYMQAEWNAQESSVVSLLVSSVHRDNLSESIVNEQQMAILNQDCNMKINRKLMHTTSLNCENRSKELENKHAMGNKWRWRGEL